MSATDMQALVNENAYIETQEFVANLESKLTDEQVVAFRKEYAVDLIAGGTHFVATYEGENNFVRQLKGKMVRFGGLTVPQVRAALNVLRDEVRKGSIRVATKDDRADAPVAMTQKKGDSGPVVAEIEEGLEMPDETHRTQCYKTGCGRWFTSVPAVLAHKTVAHRYYGGETAVAVLKDHEVEETFLDVSSIPDGRYAFPDPKNGNDFMYLSIKTVKRDTYRDRKYRYGKFRVGNEVIKAGTIEVRTWSQDAKKLVGMQKPGEGYRGEFVDVLVGIMERPEAWAKVFAVTIGACGICGKTLTDDESRGLGIGPDCFDRWGLDYWKKFSRHAELIRFREEHGLDIFTGEPLVPVNS